MQRHGDYLAFFNDSDIPSHWYRCEFIYKGLVFNHVEKFMMVAKARLFGDMATAGRIMAADHPKRCKDLGREVEGFDEAIWQQYNFRIITVGNREKYRQNPGLARFLMDTWPLNLVEASPYDTTYGIGLGKDDVRIANPDLHRGKNLCGNSQMIVRDELLQASRVQLGLPYQA